MNLFPWYIITSRHNSRTPINRDASIRHLGYLGWRAPTKEPRPLRDGVVLTLLPRAEWAGRIAAIADRQLVNQFPLPAKDQNGLGYCWCYGSTRALEIERRRLGLDNLDLCPESVGGPCTNWRNEGGYAREYMDYAEKHGVCESRFADDPHRLQPQLWQPGWQDNAASHRVATWLDIEHGDAEPTFDELVSALLGPETDGSTCRPVAIGLPWWGHLVCALGAYILPPTTDCDANTPTGDKIGVLFQNSWGPDWPSAGANGYAVLVERLATPDGAAVPDIVM